MSEPSSIPEPDRSTLDGNGANIEPADELLAYGVVADGGGQRHTAVLVAGRPIGLSRLIELGLLVDTDPALLAGPDLNPLIGAQPEEWDRLRSELIDLVATGDHVAADLGPEPVPVLPIQVGDYVDFYSSIEHATNLGRMFRPDSEPLMPNWRHLPIGYHGRAGTVIASGTPVRRPHGQFKGPDDAAPRFGPSRRLDIELELGAILAAGSGWSGDDLDAGFDAEPHLFGLVVVNDWSARDIQAWEYQPLGPFLGKSFATSISPWVVPWAALNPYRVAAPAQEPDPLPHLQVAERYGLDIGLTVDIMPAGADRYETISTTNAADLYWTFGQQVAHMTSNGAGIRNGDLIATGTISGSEPGSEGSLIELTWAGSQPVLLEDGRELGFLEDGDTIRLSGRLGARAAGGGSGQGQGAGIGPSIGACVGRIVT